MGRPVVPQDIMAAAFMVILDRCDGHVRLDTSTMAGRKIESEVKFETVEGVTWLDIRINEIPEAQA